MKTLREWKEVYENELTILELTSDEEAIRKEVAEFEQKLRAEYATKKEQKVSHLKTSIAVVDEIIAREDEEERIKLAIENEQNYETAVEEVAKEEVIVEPTSIVVEDNLFSI